MLFLDDEELFFEGWSEDENWNGSYNEDTTKSTSCPEFSETFHTESASIEEESSRSLVIWIIGFFGKIYDF